MLHTPSEAIGSVVPIYGAGDGGSGGGGSATDIYEAAIVVGNALAGDTTNAILTGNSIRNNLTISTATVVNTIATSNRIVGAYSDAGTGTTIGNNIVGP